MAGCGLPDVCKGLILCWDAGLTRGEADTVHYWLKGDYKLTSVIEAVRRLERPMAVGQASTVRAYWLEANQGEGWSSWPDETGWEIEEEYAQTWSDWSTPEPEVVGETEGEAGSIEPTTTEEDFPLEENVVQTALAVYPAVREALRKDVIFRIARQHRRIFAGAFGALFL